MICKAVITLSEDWIAVHRDQFYNELTLAMVSICVEPLSFQVNLDKIIVTANTNLDIEMTAVDWSKYIDQAMANIGSTPYVVRVSTQINQLLIGVGIFVAVTAALIWWRSK